MPDNLEITAGTGTPIATDLVGTEHYQRIKLTDGLADSNTPINADEGGVTNALRVCPADDITDATYIGDIKFGESLPAGTNEIGKLAAGTAGIGKLTANNGVDIGDVDVTSILPGTAAANLGKVEDAGHTTGDVGVMMLGVRNDSDTELAGTDLDYIPIACDLHGHIIVEASEEGQSAADYAHGLMPICGVVLDALPATDTIAGNGEWGVFQMTQYGELRVKDESANTLLGTIDSDTGDMLTALQLIDDAVDGNYLNVNLNIEGADVTAGEGNIDAQTLRVTIATDDDGVAHLATIAGDTTGIETAVEIMDDWDATHDSAASADGVQLMAAYDSTKPTAVGDADAVRVLADAYGRLLAGVEPQAFQAVFDSANASAEGNAVHASAASTIIVVQSYVISSDTELWVKLQEQDSTALTGKFYLKAGGGVAITLPDKAPIVLAVDSDLEVITEGAGSISVSVTGYTIPG